MIYPSPRELEAAEATEQLESIIAHTGRYSFRFNPKFERFEFWERRGPYHNLVFPLTVNDKSLPKITSWEIKHAVEFVRSKRASEEEDRRKHEAKMIEQRKIAQSS